MLETKQNQKKKDGDEGRERVFSLFSPLSFPFKSPEIFSHRILFPHPFVKTSKRERIIFLKSRKRK